MLPQRRHPTNQAGQLQRQQADELRSGRPTDPSTVPSSLPTPREPIERRPHRLPLPVLPSLFHERARCRPPLDRNSKLPLLVTGRSRCRILATSLAGRSFTFAKTSPAHVPFRSAAAFRASKCACAPGKAKRAPASKSRTHISTAAAMHACCCWWWLCSCHAGVHGSLSLSLHSHALRRTPAYIIDAGIAACVRALWRGGHYYLLTVPYAHARNMGERERERQQQSRRDARFANKL